MHVLPSVSLIVSELKICFASLWLTEVQQNERKEKLISLCRSYYHFKSGGSTRHHFVHRACILVHVFFCAFLLQFSFIFLILQALGRSHPSRPCFLVFSFLILFSTCISYKLSCLNWACCAQVFYVLENVCCL